jgi:hypothetical protein
MMVFSGLEGQLHISGLSEPKVHHIEEEMGISSINGRFSRVINVYPTL